MSYSTAATKGTGAQTRHLRRTELLLRNADHAWIVLTDLGYELYVLGELLSTSYSLGEAIDELDTALLGSHLRGLPEEVPTMEVADGIWGVDLAELSRQALS